MSNIYKVTQSSPLLSQSNTKLIVKVFGFGFEKYDIKLIYDKSLLHSDNTDEQGLIKLNNIQPTEDGLIYTCEFKAINFQADKETNISTGCIGYDSEGNATVLETKDIIEVAISSEETHVGFDKVIVFDNYGKVLDTQTNYNENYKKTITAFLPYSLKFDFNKIPDDLEPMLLVSINNTFPKQIVTINGLTSVTDYNKFRFDISDIEHKYQNNGLGLMQVVIKQYNKVFKTDTFRGV